MSERPILFNGAMVRAIVEGRKTQTRRPIKPQPSRSRAKPPFLKHFGAETGNYGERDREWLNRSHDPTRTLKAPCAVGDILWVRETWRPVMEAWCSFVEYRASGSVLDVHRDVMEATIRKSGGALRFPGANQKYINENWRPSIHMPRWACRIFLRVAEVRAERLKSIACTDDHEAEGFKTQSQFLDCWNDIYEAKGLGTDVNPWVWAITFERCGAPA